MAFSYYIDYPLVSSAPTLYQVGKKRQDDFRVISKTFIINTLGSSPRPLMMQP
jgi:hypothetical protein